MNEWQTIDGVTVVPIRAGDSVVVVMPDGDVEDVARVRRAFEVDLPDVPVLVLAGHVRVSARPEDAQ